jgi:hypothetical protein
MKLVIDESILADNNLTLDEYLVLILNAREADINSCISSLVSKNWGEPDLFDETKIVLSNTIKEDIYSISIDSQLVKDRQEDFESLANKLKEVFPKGMKSGTSYSWRGNTAEIVRKLKNLVVKYHCRFTEEEALDAARAYVASFNGDYKYMKLLKYFLLKTIRNKEGDIDIESEFMSYLENKDDLKEQNNNNWTTDLA